MLSSISLSPRAVFTLKMEVWRRAEGARMQRPFWSGLDSAAGRCAAAEPGCGEAPQNPVCPARTCLNTSSSWVSVRMPCLLPSSTAAMTSAASAEELASLPD